MKVISKKHFATVTKGTVHEKTFFNGGRCTFEYNIYTKYLVYFSSVAEKDLRSIFKARFEGDRLFLIQSTVDGQELGFGVFEELRRLE